MASTKLCSTFILLLFLQGDYAQQSLTSNNKAGINNAIGLQQQLQRMNTQNNINQIPNGGLNFNMPQQANMQQGSLQQPVNGNLQGNVQHSLSLPDNSQPQGTSIPLANLQITKQEFVPLPPGFVANPSKSSQTISTQFNNARQNAQIPQQFNIGPASNCPMAQSQNGPFSSNSLAEIAALKGHPSLLSLFTSPNNAQTQTNQQMAVPNFNPAQNQLSDVQKQFLVRALQSQSSGQSQPGSNFAQSQLRVAGGDNQLPTTYQASQWPQQQSQAIVSPMSNQPSYITVQAQPLTSYLQAQSPIIQTQVEEEPSILSLILSELQPPDSQYNIYPSYSTQKSGSKSNLKTLIPLIINLLKEKNNCGCRNCGCQNNGCNNNSMLEPAIFSGYANQKNYSQGTDKSSKTNSNAVTSKKNDKEPNNVKTNSGNVDSEEVSEENDSEYVDDSGEGD